MNQIIDRQADVHLLAEGIEATANTCHLLSAG